MKIKIPAGNWHMALADAIESAKDGDVIVIKSDAQKQLGLSAKGRMCPNKDITFEWGRPLRKIDYQRVFRNWAHMNRLCRFED